jgi:hypothetical protein
MEHARRNNETIPTRAVWIYGAAACFCVFFYALAMICASWTFWLDCSQVTISMEINVFEGSFFEVRVKDGSRHTKEKVDTQKDRLGVRHDDLHLPFGLWAFDGRR